MIFPACENVFQAVVTKFCRLEKYLLTTSSDIFPAADMILLPAHLIPMPADFVLLPGEIHRNRSKRNLSAGRSVPDHMNGRPW
jgi:hypothetical protein